MGKSVIAKCGVDANVHHLLHCTVCMCAMRCLGKTEKRHVLWGQNFRQVRSSVLPGNAWNWPLIQLGQLHLLRNVLGLANSSSQADERGEGKCSLRKMHLVHRYTLFIVCTWLLQPCRPTRSLILEQWSSCGPEKTPPPWRAYTELLEPHMTLSSLRKDHWQPMPSWDLKPVGSYFSNTENNVAYSILYNHVSRLRPTSFCLHQRHIYPLSTPTGHSPWTTLPFETITQVILKIMFTG